MLLVTHQFRRRWQARHTVLLVQFRSKLDRYPEKSPTCSLSPYEVARGKIGISGSLYLRDMIQGEVRCYLHHIYTS